MGFVQISDDLKNWEWFDDKNTVYVLLWLTLRAAWCDTRYRGEELKRGQVATTVSEIAEKCGISVKQTRTILERLKRTNKAAIRTTTKFSIITLIEYDCAAQSGALNGNQTANERQTKGKPSLYNTNNNTIKPPNTALTREGGVLEELFDQFWLAYPKKTAKQQAQKAFEKLKPDEELLSKMLSSLERQKQSVQWTKDGGQYIPYPATWLNGRRWEDELLEKQEENTHGESRRDITTRSREEWLLGFDCAAGYR